MRTIAKNLRNIRKSKELTQEELAKLSGVSRTAITEIESEAHANITIFVLCSLCKALNITPNELIPEDMYK